MVSVEFVNIEGRVAHQAGPFPAVRLDGGRLFAGDRQLGALGGGRWDFGEGSVTRVRLHGSHCTLRFEGDEDGGADARGPFERIELVDGAIYAEPGRVLVARHVERDGRWHSYNDGRVWPVLVVEWCAEGGGDA